uniref:DNA mismatch repair endonuclease MutL n=1 Tax=Faecalitalea cylindroides TaxID=39483 RepID=UPI003AB141E8
MSKIHVLSEHLTNMIAAGEVVERPAGIVKECVENSIDAKAKTIEIEAFQGGIERLIITDDGIGMDKEDAHLAFMRHATSKMHSEEDLFNIHTMGFRGEALPSIASVAKVELNTNDSNESTLIRYSYGELICEESSSCPRGTKIDISGLFVKTPARFKHLKSPSYEFSVIADIVNKMALSHPEIRFKLSHDGRVVFQTSGNGKIQEILYQMYGREVAENAVYFEEKNDDFKIHGYAIQPKINRATKYFMYITLNTRLIRSVPIQKAILDAYSHFLPPNRFPIVVLQIESDAQLVDVNVHPNKWEVRLSKQNDLLELVKNTIRDALSNSLQTVQIKPKVKTPIFEQETLNFPYPIKNERKTESIIEKGFKKKEKYEKSYDYPIKTNPSIKEEKIEYPAELEVLTKPELQKEESIEEIESVEKAVGYEFFYHLKVIVQLKDSYILCENEEGLVIIDQHAAQERYHYEMLQETLNKPCNNLQPLMLPIQLDVSSNIMSQVNTINEKTSFFGLEFEPFGNDQLIVREIPLWFQDVHEEAFLYDLL